MATTAIASTLPRPTLSLLVGPSRTPWRSLEPLGDWLAHVLRSQRRRGTGVPRLTIRAGGFGFGAGE